VRRAQQAASAAAAPRDSGSAGNQILEEARARARAAAAQAEASEPKSSGGPLGLAKSLFSGRKRSSIAGLSALVMVLGALQAASMYYQYDRAKPVESAENRAAPTAQQAAAEKSSARVEAAAPSPLSERFAQAAPMAADMTPVASVPPNAFRAPRPDAPAAPRDPFVLAAAGDAHAQYELGVRFADGRHAPRDAARAIDWLSKSAAQNFAPAQYRLGVIYEKGLGAPRDSERARTLYLGAAERGNVKAMHNLGALLADGSVGGKPDYAAATRWFRLAAEHGVRDSQYNLGVLSARGLGMTQDLVQSYMWFAAAAAQGDTGAGAKLKEVASRLDAAQMAKAQAMAETLRPRTADAAVNDPIAPEGGWATAPEPSTAKPSASRSPKISSL
jgi:localization factor PodJL